MNLFIIFHLKILKWSIITVLKGNLLGTITGSMIREKQKLKKFVTR